MRKIASPQDLASELQALIKLSGSGLPSRAKLAAELRRLADQVASTDDNSWGRGYYPLPHQLAGLGRFVSALRPGKLLDHKFFPDSDGGTHMLVAQVDSNFSVMGADMRSLLKLGLSRMQSNSPGTIAFYFSGYPGELG